MVGQHSALLGYPHEDKISLLANHMSVCRSPSFDDSNYRDVADALRRSATEITKRIALLTRPASGLTSAKPTHVREFCFKQVGPVAFSGFWPCWFQPKGSTSTSWAEEAGLPFLAAAEQGHGDIASLLLQQQCIRVEDTDHKDQSPFLVAAASGSMSCLNIFINDIRVNINHLNRSGRSALPFAAEEGMESVVKALLSAKRMDFPFGRQ